MAPALSLRTRLCFLGTNELDQVQKIHSILGTPSPELLSKMKRRSQHMDFHFPYKEGSSIEKLIPHASPQFVDLIAKLLAYNPDDRLSARQALRHPYLRELREAEKRARAMMPYDLSSALHHPSSSLISIPNQNGGKNCSYGSDSKLSATSSSTTSTGKAAAIETGAHKGASSSTQLEKVEDVKGSNGQVRHVIFVGLLLVHIPVS